MSAAGDRTNLRAVAVRRFVESAVWPLPVYQAKLIASAFAEPKRWIAVSVRLEVADVRTTAHGAIPMDVFSAAWPHPNDGIRFVDGFAGLDDRLARAGGLGTQPTNLFSRQADLPQFAAFECAEDFNGRHRLKTLCSWP